MGVLVECRFAPAARVPCGYNSSMQISDKEIRRNTQPQVIARARSIAARPAMFDEARAHTQVKRGVEQTEISALVTSSDHFDAYETTVYLDERAGEINDYDCTCPAADKYPGMCKHAVALVLRYNEEPAAFTRPAGAGRTHTSPGLAAFMAGEAVAVREGAEGPIDLIPEFTCYFNTWSVSFKIGREGAWYVLKSVGAFVDCMRRRDTFSYGKKLQFTHTVSRLTPRAQAIYAVLERVYDRASASRYMYAYSPAMRVGRDVDLTSEDAIALFDALEGASFDVDNKMQALELGRAHCVKRVHMDVADPDLGFAIAEVSGGYELSAREAFMPIAHGRRLYVMCDSTLYRCSKNLARLAPVLANLADTGAQFVAADDARLFASTVLPLLEQATQGQGQGPGQGKPLAPASLAALRPMPCELRFYFDKVKGGVVCEAKAAYGAYAYPLMNETFDIPEAPPRDKAAEDVGRAVVNKYLALRTNAGDAVAAQLARSKVRGRTKAARAARNLAEAQEAVAAAAASNAAMKAGEPALPFIPFDDDDGLLGLLFGGLAEFRAIGDVYTTPAFDRLLFDARPSVKVGLSVSGNLLNLDVASDELDPLDLAALLGSYRRRKHYHKLKSGAFVDIRDMDAEALARALDDLGISDKDLARSLSEDGHLELPAYQAFYLDSQLEDADRDASFAQYVTNFHEAKGRTYTVPPSLQSVLRPYQREGFEWLSLVADCGFGGILADEMGLGKSVQLIAWLLSTRDAARATGPSLVVCPASLVFNWMAEFERFAPELSVAPMVGAKRERVAARALPVDVLVTSYDLMRIDGAALAERDFFCIALDEAQYIKNHATKTAQVARKLKARYRFALTGTPMENRPSELWSIFSFLMPGLLGSAMRFRENFEIPVLGNDAGAIDRLHALVSPFVLRRLKADVLTDLPDKLESDVFTQLEGEQAKLYRAHEQDLREKLNDQKRLTHSRGRQTGKVRDEDINKVEILAELTRLRQLCLDPALVYENYAGGAAKLDTIMELVAQGVESGQKMLVFSQFTSFLARIDERLSQAGIAFYTITGATPKKRRLELVNAFNDNDVPVFLISLKAGGTGLNLTGASVVIHADPWWNAAAQNQATDRAHRIGQTREVTVFKVVAKGTIEERIVALQRTKSDMAAALVEGAGLSLASMTTDELVSLLG